MLSLLSLSIKVDIELEGKSPTLLKSFSQHKLILRKIAKPVLNDSAISVCYQAT
ncbi:hypothetical protein ACIN8IBEIGE_50150 [Acinetobacter sp. 8I-beige]|nr:hypothetical protein ACIN8IBEIGE_50150 [Acinetobacter sp. 8I-beige]